MAEKEYRSTMDNAENKYLSRTSSALSLRYSSSQFDSHNSASDTDEESRRVEPYLYEPQQSSSDEAGGKSSDDDAN